MDQVDTERGGIDPAEDDDMTIKSLRGALLPNSIAFHNFPRWAIVRQALVEAGTRHEALTLALLVGLRACAAKLYSQKRNMSEYRDLQALLVLGYCLGSATTPTSIKRPSFRSRES